MKKTLVSIVLVMVAVAAAQDAAPQQQTQPTAPQQQPQSSAPQQPSAQPPTGQGTTPTGQTPPSSTGQASAGQAPAGQAPAAPVAPQQKKEIKLKRKWYGFGRNCCSSLESGSMTTSSNWEEILWMVFD